MKNNLHHNVCNFINICEILIKSSNEFKKNGFDEKGKYMF